MYVYRRICVTYIILGCCATCYPTSPQKIQIVAFGLKKNAPIPGDTGDDDKDACMEGRRLIWSDGRPTINLLVKSRCHRIRTWRSGLRHLTHSATGQNNNNNHNKRAQLSLRKTRYSQFSACCSTDLISHRFRNTATYSLKPSIENCGQTAADGNMVTIHSLQEVASALSDGTIADPSRLIV